MNREIILIASGDLRLEANQTCWPAQVEMENQLVEALVQKGWKVTRAHPYDEEKKHGFIDSQRMGIEVFKQIDRKRPLIVAESLWQFTHHILAGLISHEGPILTVANWSGQWPGLVGMLNLNGSLTKAGVHFSTLWSKDFNDDFFMSGLAEWLEFGEIRHDKGHVKDYELKKIPKEDLRLGKAFAKKFFYDKAILGVFDEGCMGMFNAIVPDELLNKLGIFKERLSQSALYAEMCNVEDGEAEKILKWLLEKRMKFEWGSDNASQLTREQSLLQCKMYIAALRIADTYGCDAIGIQYQQGLNDLTPASDLVEGLLNNRERPPVFSKNGKELYPGDALPHFNEVDECSAIDGLITYNLWKELGYAGENTLHDVRWGEDYHGHEINDFVWVFLISGAVPASHLIGGYSGATSKRQPAMFFKKGGGTLTGISKPGNIVWSRIFIMNNQLHCDLGVGKCVELPEVETNRRWSSTTPEWPIMHAVLRGITKNQFMARHQANHIQVAYAPDLEIAESLCRIKASVMAELGINTHFCGELTLC